MANSTLIGTASAPASTVDAGADSSELSTYAEKHLVPWLTEHLKMRAIGFQVFPAVQAGVFVAYANLRHWSVACLGISLCLSFLMWDARNRDVFRRIHEMCFELVEKRIFGGDMNAGLHGQALERLKANTGMNLRQLGSHTWAIRLMALTAIILWAGLLISPPPIPSSLSSESDQLANPSTSKPASDLGTTGSGGISSSTNPDIQSAKDGVRKDPPPAKQSKKAPSGDNKG